jgi:hypothetical protein
MVGDDGEEQEFRGGPFVSKMLNEMRCRVCGHRLDDMGGCDSCAADREAEERAVIFEERDDHEGDPAWNGAFDDRR